MALRSKGDRHMQAYKKHILYNQVPTSIKLFIHIVIKFVPYQSTLGLMSLAARAVCSGVMVWNILGIAGDIYTETVKSQYETVVPAFGMVFLFARSGVVRRHGFNLYVISKPQMVAIVHDFAIANDFGTVGIRDDYGRWLFQLSDSHRVAVIKVLMCHEDVVSFGIGSVIRRRLQATHRVHFYLTTVKRDANAAMFDGGKDNFLAALGLERVCLGSSVL